MKILTVKHGSIMTMILIVINLLGVLSKHRLLLYENRCFINQTNDTIINFELSQQRHAAIFVKGLFLIHKYSCYARCCDTENCNVVSFHQMNQKDGTNHNCKLYYCPVISNCIFQTQKDHMLCITGPLDTLSLPSDGSDTVEDHVKSTTTPNLESSVATTKPHLNYITGNKQTLEDVSGTTFSTLSTNETGIIIKKYDSTSSGSLIAVIFFGLLFLLIIAGLVARRWLEFAQKRNYSKVDYLINDMYS